MSTITIEPAGTQESVPYVRVRGEFASFVLEALADRVSRRIMTSATESPKTIEEISEQQSIPLSTCYRRM